MSIKKYQEDFQIINEAYYLYVMDDEVKEESLEFQEQEKLYNDVEDKIWKSLQLYADCEESYEVYKAGLPEPCLTKKEVEEDSMSAKVNKDDLQAQLVS